MKEKMMSTERQSFEIIPLPPSEAIPCADHSKRKNILFNKAILPKEQLICFNWDTTLISVNSYDQIKSEGISAQKLTRGLIVNDMLPDKCTMNCSYRHDKVMNFITKFYSQKGVFGNSDEIVKIISGLLSKGVNIAIIAYNEFPIFIKTGLEKMGFNIAEICKMNIICGFPNVKERLIGKMEHIAKAKELSSVLIKNENIIIVDSDENSIKIAKNNGMISCHKGDEDILEVIKKVKAITLAKEDRVFQEEFKDIYNELIKTNLSNDLSPTGSNDLSPTGSNDLLATNFEAFAPKTFEDEYGDLVSSWNTPDEIDLTYF